MILSKELELSVLCPMGGVTKIKYLKLEQESVLIFYQKVAIVMSVVML